MKKDAEDEFVDAEESKEDEGISTVWLMGTLDP